MLFIYLLEGDAKYALRADLTLRKSVQHGDQLMTSWLAIAEVMAGASRSQVPGFADAVQALIRKIPFQVVGFDDRCVNAFSTLRRSKVGVADSIHLACASASEVDLFLTNDVALHRLRVPGIRFISGLDADLV